MPCARGIEEWWTEERESRGEAERAGPEAEGGPAAVCWAERRKEEKKRERVDGLG